jgi:hypothetical protein
MCRITTPKHKRPKQHFDLVFESDKLFAASSNSNSGTTATCSTHRDVNNCFKHFRDLDLRREDYTCIFLLSV